MGEEGIDITAAHPKILTTHVPSTGDVRVRPGGGMLCR
jgi:hypothetical protein